MFWSCSVNLNEHDCHLAAWRLWGLQVSTAYLLQNSEWFENTSFLMYNELYAYGTICIGISGLSLDGRTVMEVNFHPCCNFHATAVGATGLFGTYKRGSYMPMHMFRCVLEHLKGWWIWVSMRPIRKGTSQVTVLLHGGRWELKAHG